MGHSDTIFTKRWLLRAFVASPEVTLAPASEWVRLLKVPLLFLVDEAYTSQTCPCCQRRKKVQTRNYVLCVRLRRTLGHSRCRNILAKELYGKMCHIPEETRESICGLRKQKVVDGVFPPFCMCRSCLVE